MLEDEQAEIFEVERRQVWVQGTYEILVEPLCFFYLKAYSLNGLELLFGEIDYEPYA